jgi:hypothetical protein
MTRRLIEEWLPVAELGEESARERRSMTAVPPIYYLHVWWARTNGLEATRALLENNKLVEEPDFQNALAAVLEVLPVSSTFTGFDDEKGEVAEAAQDFDVLENIRRLLFSETVPRPKQLELWLDQ